MLLSKANGYPQLGNKLYEENDKMRGSYCKYS